MESLHQSHSRKDLLTQLSAVMGFISSEENPMARFSYSLEQTTSKDRLWWGRKSQPANREWCVLGEMGGGGVDLGKISRLA